MDTRNPWRLLAALTLIAATACAEDPPDLADEAVDHVEGEATFVGGTTLLANPASVCWVLPPGSPVTQADLDGMQANIDEWTTGDTALHFNFASDLSAFTNLTIGGVTYRTSCTRRSNKKFVQNLRLYIDNQSYPDSPTPYPDSLTIPGCSADEPVGVQVYNDDGTRKQNGGLYVAAVFLWSMFPKSIVDNPRCLYTTHLFLGQARNNYQHELGHSLGLAHEHVRVDATCLPVAPADEPGDQLKVTNYDRDSVMHYVLTCSDGTTTVGNWGDTGPSESDRLAVEILYPLSGSGGGIWGHLGGWVGGYNLDAVPHWVLRGALPASADGVLKDFRWKVDGSLVSTRVYPLASELNVGAGRHTLSLELKDTWNRSHSGQVVLDQRASQADYLAVVGAVVTPL